KTLGAEMEASAIGYVAEHLDRRSIIVKAVSDHADGEKDDSFAAFAARASAKFLLAFLDKHLPPREDAPASARPGEGGDAPIKRSMTMLSPIFAAARPDEEDDFLARVQRVAKLKVGPDAILERLPAPAPFGGPLRVSQLDGGIARVYPVAAVDQPITEVLLDAFLQAIDAPYRRDDTGMISALVYRGALADPALVQKAAARRVRLMSFV